MTKQELIDAIRDEVVETLTTGNSAPKLYLRVQTSGEVRVSEETSWCCSPDEYYQRVPHTLSLEILKSTRDYSSLSQEEIEQQADCAKEAAEEIVEDWMPEIEAWIAAGNFSPTEEM